MLGNPDLVAGIYLVGGLVFLFALFAGALRTLARVIYYQSHRATRPVLLTRDAIVYGGLSISFGLITVIRFLPSDVRIAMTQGNVIWALATTIPACVAVVTYLFFEVAVIERDPEPRR